MTCLIYPMNTSLSNTYINTKNLPAAPHDPNPQKPICLTVPLLPACLLSVLLLRNTNTAAFSEFSTLSPGLDLPAFCYVRSGRKAEASRSQSLLLRQKQTRRLLVDTTE